MENLQILFPAPQLAQLRQAARVMDRPVSELVRAAVDSWLAANAPPPAPVLEAPPSFALGDIRSNAAALRQRAWRGRVEA
jgi:hypothetical protein